MATSFLIIELLHAADRRAAQHLYDAAALLVYRVLEGIAQWTLRWKHGIDPSNVSEGAVELLGEELVGRDHKGRRVMGMEQCWRALAKLDGPLAAVAKDTAEQRYDGASVRNRSIYAHGQKPVARDDFERFRRWMEERVFAPFVEVAYPRRRPHPQLPTRWD